MPDHYHIVIDTLEKFDMIKIKEDMNKYISREIILDLKNDHPEILEKLQIETPRRIGHQQYQYRLFQKGRYDFEIATDIKLFEKLEYMHDNPVRANLVEKPEDYPFSSARNYIHEDHSLIELDPLPI